MNESRWERRERIQLSSHRWFIPHSSSSPGEWLIAFSHLGTQPSTFNYVPVVGEIEADRRREGRKERGKPHRFKGLSLKLFSCTNNNKQGRWVACSCVSSTKLRCIISLADLNAMLMGCPICHYSHWSPKDLRGSLWVKRHFYPALCLVEGGVASRLMDTAKNIRAGMQIRKTCFTLMVSSLQMLAGKLKWCGEILISETNCLNLQFKSARLWTIEWMKTPTRFECCLTTNNFYFVCVRTRACVRERVPVCVGSVLA